MTDNPNPTYVVDDGDGPELWRSTDGENTQDELLLTKADVRASVYQNMTIGGHKAIADVDRLWAAIAATAGDAPKDAHVLLNDLLSEDEFSDEDGDVL